MSIIIPVVQVGYKSEWALARFFEALKNPDIANKFKLETICGRENNTNDAVNALDDRIKSISSAISAGIWRANQRGTEKENAEFLMAQLTTNKLKYCRVRKNNKLPSEAYPKENIQALILHSLNITHASYIKDGFENQCNVLCEKPLTTVVDIDGNPDDYALVNLEKIVRNFGGNLVLMDAEHYSYKKPSLIFYEKLNELLKDKNGNIRKIEKIEGEIKEIDNPDWKRTRDILSFSNNQTGLIGDTMCHLLAFISNLGGRAVPEEREYDLYDGYDADTYNQVSYKIVNSDLLKNYFSPNAEAKFTVAKFIHKIKGNDEKTSESKYIKFTLDDKSEIFLDFKNGTISKDGKDLTYFRYAINKNEYVNVMNEFYEAILDKRKALTDYRSSINTLQASYETYALSSEKNKRVKIYL
jgi:predicted dehydrogenase